MEHSHEWRTTDNVHVRVHSSSTALLQLNTVGNLTKNHVTVLWTTHTQCSAPSRERVKYHHGGITYGSGTCIPYLRNVSVQPDHLLLQWLYVTAKGLWQTQVLSQAGSKKSEGSLSQAHSTTAMYVCMRAQFSPFNARKAAPKSLHNVSLRSSQLLHGAAVVAKNQWPTYVCMKNAPQHSNDSHIARHPSLTLLSGCLPEHSLSL